MDNWTKEYQEKSSYNTEDVYYCSKCLSLAIMSQYNYCDKCGSTDIEHCNIKEWVQKYREKYGHNFLEEHSK